MWLEGKAPGGQSGVPPPSLLLYWSMQEVGHVTSFTGISPSLLRKQEDGPGVSVPMPLPPPGAWLADSACYQYSSHVASGLQVHHVRS